MTQGFMLETGNIKVDRNVCISSQYHLFRCCSPVRVHRLEPRLVSVDERPCNSDQATHKTCHKHKLSPTSVTKRVPKSYNLQHLPPIAAGVPNSRSHRSAFIRCVTNVLLPTATEWQHPWSESVILRPQERFFVARCQNLPLL